MSVKEQYWRYSLVVIILGLGTIIFVKLQPFLGGLLGALTIYILVRKQMFSLTEKRHIRRGLAAAIVLCESILCFLIPMSLVVWLVVNKLQGINLDPGSIIEPAKHIAQLVEENDAAGPSADGRPKKTTSSTPSTPKAREKPVRPGGKRETNQ